MKKFIILCRIYSGLNT